MPSRQQYRSMPQHSALALRRLTRHAVWEHVRQQAPQNHLGGLAVAHCTVRAIVR